MGIRQDTSTALCYLSMMRPVDKLLERDCDYSRRDGHGIWKAIQEEEVYAVPGVGRGL